MESSQTLLASEFATLPALIKAFAAERPDAPVSYTHLTLPTILRV